MKATYKRKKPLKIKGLIRLLAEREGFEPSVPCSTPDFESRTHMHTIKDLIHNNLRNYKKKTALKALFGKRVHFGCGDYFMHMSRYLPPLFTAFPISMTHACNAINCSAFS